MSKIKIVEQTKIKNVARGRNKVKLQFYSNTLTGNILDGQITSGCDIQLDYSCPDNSQYITTIT